MDLKSKSIITTLLAIMVLVAAYFTYSQGWTKWDAARANLARVQVDNTSLTKASQDIQNFLDKYKTLQTQARVAGIALPTKSDPAVLLANIEELAQDSGLVISAINVSEPNLDEMQKLPPYSLVALEVQLSASGSFVSFRDFLDRVERNIRIMDVEFVDTQVEDESNNLRYQIKFKTYYQK